MHVLLVFDYKPCAGSDSVKPKRVVCVTGRSAASTSLTSLPCAVHTTHDQISHQILAFVENLVLVYCNIIANPIHDSALKHTQTLAR